MSFLKDNRTLRPLDIFLIFITGGLWIIVLFVRFIKQRNMPKISISVRESTYSPMTEHEYNLMRKKEIEQFDTLYDTDSIEGIRSIPVPENVLSKTDSVTGKPEYILQTRATTHEKNGNLDLAVECLRKSNELKMYSSTNYSERDYMRLVEMLKKSRRFDEARAEESQIKRFFVTQERYFKAQKAKQFHESLRNFDTDLVEISFVSTCCPTCGKYRGRIFSVSGADSRFPKLPDDFHEDCGLIAFPFIYGVNVPQYCKPRNIFTYNNRPFKDSRTPEEKANYAAQLQAEEEKNPKTA